MLMVGTLQCRKSHPVSIDVFNDFMTRQGDELSANAVVLKGRFMRESGPARWLGDYDRFGTSIANLYSARIDDGGFCEMVTQVGRSAAAASREDLVLLSATVADAPASGACMALPGSAAGPVPLRRMPPKIAIGDALVAPTPREAVAAAVADAATSDFVSTAGESAAARSADVQVADIKAADVEAANVEAAELAGHPPVAVQVATAPAEPGPAKVELAAVSLSSGKDEGAELAEAAAAPEAAKVAIATVPKVAIAAVPKVAIATVPVAPNRDEALKAAVLALQSAVAALQAASSGKLAELR